MLADEDRNARSPRWHAASDARRDVARLGAAALSRAHTAAGTRFKHGLQTHNGRTAVAPPAIDLRRPAAQQAAAAAAEAAKYGFDPRDSVAEDVDLVPDAEFAISTGAVGSLGTVEQLQAALNAADDKQQVVVIKFMREGCTACASTVDKIKSVAKQYAGAGQFYEVNYDESKGFCRQAKVRFVPSAHIYAGNKLVDALPIGKKSWDNFKARLDECRNELAS